MQLDFFNPASHDPTETEETMDETDDVTDIEEESPKREVAAARKRVYARGALFVLILAVSAWALNTYSARLAYFFEPGDPVDLGDVRTLRANGRASLDVAPESFVRLDNMMVTNRAEDRKFNYFFCPIYNVLVRTERPLPDRSLRVARAEIQDGLEYLVEQRRVFVEDFTTSFDGQGWIRRIKDAEAWEGGLREYVIESPQLSAEQAESAWILRDGESPVSHYWSMIVLVSVVFVVLASAASLILALRAYRRIRPN